MALRTHFENGKNSSPIFVTLKLRKRKIVLKKLFSSYFLLGKTQSVADYKKHTWRSNQQHCQLFFLIISQNVAICPKTFSNRVDSHC